MKKKAKVYTVLLVIIGLTVCINASQCASSNIMSARILLNAPIDFSFPHLGNVGSCNLQTHTNGWTRENIDRWEFAPCDNFNNGVASVVVNGQTNTWTVLAPDRPLFRFGRYYCGFVREDRPDGTHAILAGLFFGGVMVGAEYLRENFDWRTHTWHELDNTPDGIRQIGGGEWEAGFVVWPKSFDNPDSACGLGCCGVLTVWTCCVPRLVDAIVFFGCFCFFLAMTGTAAACVCAIRTSRSVTEAIMTVSVRASVVVLIDVIIIDL